VNASKSGFVSGFACVAATVAYLVTSQPRQQTTYSTPEVDASTVVAAVDSENSDRLTSYASDAIKDPQEHAHGGVAKADGITMVEFANSTVTDSNHTPDVSPTRLSMPEQNAVATTTSEVHKAEPGSSAAPDATTISDYLLTPDPPIAAQDSALDTHLSDTPLPLTEATESQASELPNERFWGPFNAELRAHSFAAHLSKLIEHPLFVVRDTQGYHIVFSYASQSERDSLRNRLTNAGLTLDN